MGNIARTAYLIIIVRPPSLLPAIESLEAPITSCQGIGFLGHQLDGVVKEHVLDLVLGHAFRFLDAGRKSTRFAPFP